MTLTLPAVASAPAEWSEDVIRRALIWGACICALCSMVEGRILCDPDSLLYASISRSLESRPLSQWIAPAWPEQWPSGRGLFVDHLACFFWPAALLGKLGLPGGMAANFLWVLLSYLLVFRFARALIGEEAAWLAVLLYAVSPAGLEYLVRANHEPALACAYLGALWCLVDRPARPAALAGFLLLAVAIKGALGLLAVPVALASWWAAGRRKADVRGFLLGAVLLAAFCAAYELAFERAAGASFFDAYFARQISGVVEGERRGFLHKLATPAYHAGSVAWFGFPGTGLALADAARPSCASRCARRAWLVPAAALVVLLSLMARRAVRYAFPAFALCNVAGAQALIRRAPGVQQWIAARRSWLEPALASWLLVATALRVTFW